MKKAVLFFAFVISLTALRAAINITPYPVLQDSVGPYSATLRQNVSGFTGNYQHHYIWAAQGDTFAAGPVMSTNNVNLWRQLNGLQPATTYTVGAVVSDNGQADTAWFMSFTTGPMPPAPQPIAISNIQVNPSFGTTTVSFHYEIIGGYTGTIVAEYESFTHNSNVVTLSGNGNATLLITSPNVSGVTYNNNYLHFQTSGTVPGVSADTWISFNDFTVPLPMMADITNLSLVAVAPDSMMATANITIGNAGYVIVTPKLLTAAGQVSLSPPTFTAYHDTLLQWNIADLLVATGYKFWLKLENNLGLDSAQTPVVSTLQVPAASVVSWDTVNATATSTNISVVANGNGTWTGSDYRAWMTWADKNGVWHTSDTLLSDSSMASAQTFIFGPFTNLRNADEGTNPAIIYLKNDAGLLTQQTITYKVQAPKPAIPIYWGILYGQPNALTVENIGLTVPAGDAADVFAFVQMDGSGGVDTFMLHNDYTGSMPSTNMAPIGGLISGWYSVRIATLNTSNVWYVNAQIKTEFAIEGDDPVHVIAPADVHPTSNSVTFSVNGSGNGVGAHWTCNIYEYGTTNPVATYSDFPGDQEFTITKTATGLIPSTHFVIVSQLQSVFGGPIQEIQMEFWTLSPAVDIQEALNSGWQIICRDSYNALGQLVTLNESTNQLLFTKTTLEKEGKKRIIIDKIVH